MSAQDGRDPTRGLRRRVQFAPTLVLAVAVAAAVAAMPAGLTYHDGRLQPQLHDAIASNDSDSGAYGEDGDDHEDGKGREDGSDHRERSDASESGTDEDRKSIGKDDGRQSRGLDRDDDSDAESLDPIGIGRHALRQETDRGVTLAHFTTKFRRRLPANRVNILRDSSQPVSYFTEIVGMHGQTITHRWSYGDRVVYEASTMINASKWRFWSTQILPADKPGVWRVEVVDGSNKVLQAGTLEYRPAG